jgi:hypothetical protein
MAISQTSTLLLTIGVLLFLARPAHAFGAGNIGSTSAVEGVNCMLLLIPPSIYLSNKFCQGAMVISKIPSSLSSCLELAVERISAN